MNPTATVSWFGIHTITHRQNVQNFFDKLTYYDQENTQHLHEWIQTCFTMTTEEPDNKASTTQHPTTTTRPSQEKVQSVSGYLTNRALTTHRTTSTYTTYAQWIQTYTTMTTTRYLTSPTETRGNIQV